MYALPGNNVRSKIVAGLSVPQKKSQIVDNQPNMLWNEYHYQTSNNNTLQMTSVIYNTYVQSFKSPYAHAFKSFQKHIYKQNSKELDR